ncbi:hypothetical protein FA15DRAFT_645737 [Coprinopsis marcescibilis]|uniref:BTB domain-containing protein n=1 Tax=Coprinopsis marcescibilis TaxID=230819 RepID=A0A5C3KLT8_COPMA|nr:hypothetical protein FA15DRAFT_645737 [Coprinopsis marcescibilis]
MSETGPSEQKHAPERNFFWECIVFKVEDELFSVPKNEFVRVSDVFADMFEMPSGEGRDRDHPITLEGYTKREFRSLLNVMFPLHEYLIPDSGTTLKFSKEEWLGVLKLASTWNMAKIKGYAAQEIGKLTDEQAIRPLEKIQLARRHSVPNWLEEGITSLLEQSEPTPLDEFEETVGLSTASRILAIRDACGSGVLVGTSSPQLSVSNRFRMDSMRCGNCASSAVIFTKHTCQHCKTTLTAGSVLSFASAPADVSRQHTISLTEALCGSCNRCPFPPKGAAFACPTCSSSHYVSHSAIRVQTFSVFHARKRLIDKYFGEEIKEHRSWVA